MDKFISHIKWFNAIIPVGIFGMITAPFIVPIAWVLELIIPTKNPLWIWLDDEIEHESTNEDWLVYKENEGPLAWYKWHAFRNTIWNLKSYIKPENARENCITNDEVIEEILVDELYRNGNKVSIYGKCLEMASFKWVTKEGIEGWQVNNGVRISEKYSTKGESKLWYKANGVLYFRWSIAKIISIFKTKFYFEFKMGSNEKRYLLTLKIKKVK